MTPAARGPGGLSAPVRAEEEGADEAALLAQPRPRLGWGLGVGVVLPRRGAVKPSRGRREGRRLC